MAGYVWNGVPEPPAMPAPKPPRAPQTNAAACGTYSGYKAHKTRGDEACHSCKEALAAYCREYRARLKDGGITPRRPSSCGSHTGYTAHKVRGDKACEPCLIAHATYMRAYNAARKAAGTVPPPKPLGRRARPFDPSLCGTTAGWNQHSRHKQPRCEACKQARKIYDAEYLARKRANELLRPQQRRAEIAWETNTPAGKIGSTDVNKTARQLLPTTVIRA